MDLNREKFLQYNLERNESVKERYELAIGRIVQIADDSILEEPYRTYFVKISNLFLKLDCLWKHINEGTKGIGTVWMLQQQKQWNELLCSSDWAVKDIPEENQYKKILSILCSEISSKISDVYRGRLDLLTIDAELFLEIYYIFQDEPNVRQVEQAIYWHNSDYADIFEEDLVERILGICPSYEEEIICNPNEEKWPEEILYEYGYKVTKKHYKIAQEYSQLSTEKIQRLVTFVMEQYLNYQDCDNLQGKILPICFDMGLEKVAKQLVERLRTKQITVVVCQIEDLCPELLYDREYETNKCSWMDRQYKERRLQVLRIQLEKYKGKAERCLSPLVLYSGVMEQTKYNCAAEVEQTQNEKQKKMWKEYFEEQENVLYSYIPYKTCIVL